MPYFQENNVRLVKMIPDYSQTFFPPPPGATDEGNPPQTNVSQRNLPPPPPGRNRPRTISHPAYIPSLAQSTTTTTFHRPNASSLPGEGTPLSASFSIPYPRAQNASSSTTASQIAQYPPSQYNSQFNTPQPSPRLLGSTTSTTLQPPYSSAPPSPFPPHSPAYPPPQRSSGVPSNLPPQTPTFRTHFASLTMHSTDHIRFLRFPPSLLPLLRNTILASWPRGIQSSTTHHPTLDFKLKGHPWSSSRTEIKALKTPFANTESDAIHSRRLVCRLLAALHSAGWVLMMSTDISKLAFDTDTLVFRHQSPAPAECDWFSVAFSSASRLRLIDAPASVVLGVVERLGRGGEEVRCKELRTEGCCDVRVHGAGWMGGSEEGARLGELVLDVVECLEGDGWTLYASVDQKAGSEGIGETDTWHCCRPRGWERGAPVYHN